MNFNRIEVKKFRLPCSKQAGVYRWWFPEERAKSLLNALNGVDYEPIEKEEINGKQYWCLYIGSSSDLEQRFYWHTTQGHSPTAIKNSTLSTLRQTICALLKINQSDATAKQLWKEFGYHLGKLLQVVYYTYAPQAIVIGGGLSHASEFFYEAMRKSLHEGFIYPNELNDSTIRFSTLANSNLLGASCLP